MEFSMGQQRLGIWEEIYIVVIANMLCDPIKFGSHKERFLISCC